MKFVKMHGLGNDFVVVPWAEEVPTNIAEIAIAVCDRHFGVGADGLVLLRPSTRADIQMLIFNADGQQAQQCGNAIRCVTKYYIEEMGGAHDVCTVETHLGVQPVWPQMDGDRVRAICVDMGAPILTPVAIPVASSLPQVINQPIQVEDQTFCFTAVSMGNPHLVIEVEQPDTFPVEKWGPLLEHHAFYPERTNVEFISIHSPTEITMRVWERGAGQTLACGSGACAVLVAAVLLEKAERQAVIHLPHGDLAIEWRAKDNHVYMTGSATTVYHGGWNQPSTMATEVDQY